MEVLEVAAFRLASGVSDESFKNADTAMQRWSYVHVPGLRRRTTARNAEGTWCVLTVYSPAPALVSLEELTTQSGAPGEFAKLIDASSFRLARFETLD